MRITDRDQLDRENLFGMGEPNVTFASYFTGKSYLNPLVKPGETPLTLTNVTFEPGCRNNWHRHTAVNGGGQMLICTAGEGWFQGEGKKAVSLSAGSFVYVPRGIRHWHGAKSDSWFAHISLDLPAEGGGIEWLEPVSDDIYGKLKPSPEKGALPSRKGAEDYLTKRGFNKVNMFGTGIYNFMLAKYFSGRSYLKMIAMPGRTPLFLANVTFEPGCRNNWHIHHASKGGGQMLICTAGSGWFQEKGKEGVSLSEGSIQFIPAGVKHWHGAKSGGWFSHIALEIPGEEGRNEWCEAVSDEEYGKLS